MSSSTSKPTKRYLDAKQIDDLYKQLPPIASPEFQALLHHATAAELPAQVLVRASQQVKAGSPEFDAILMRLLSMEDKYGYLTPLRTAARRMVENNDSINEDDLVEEAVVEIWKALKGPRGKNADLYWVSFLRQRLVDGYRALAGTGEQEPPIVRSYVDNEGERINPADEVPSGIQVGWHGNIDPDNKEFLENFVAAEIEKMADPLMKQVAQDQFSDYPSTDVALADRLDIDRRRIPKLRNSARARIYAALKMQQEVDVDLSGWKVEQ